MSVPPLIPLPVAASRKEPAVQRRCRSDYFSSIVHLFLFRGLLLPSGRAQPLPHGHPGTQMPTVLRAHLRSDQKLPAEPPFRARAAPGQAEDGQRMPQKQQVRQQPPPLHGPLAPAPEAAAASAGPEQRQAETDQPQAGHKRLAGRRNTHREGGLYRGRLRVGALSFFSFFFFPFTTCS